MRTHGIVAWLLGVGLCGFVVGCAGSSATPQPTGDSSAAQPGIGPPGSGSLTPEQAKYKVYQLWEAGEAASNRGEHKRAGALWESIKRLPGVKEEDWPLGLNARIELAKKNIK